MNNRMDWPRLARYLAGECSPEEKRAVDDWVRADPARRQQLDVLRRIWAASDGPSAKKPSGTVGSDEDREAEDREAEEDWRRVARHIQATRQTEAASRPARRGASPGRRASRTPQRSRRKRRPVVPRGVGVAVALMLLVGGVWLAMQVGFSFDGSASSAWREIVTERGERAKIQLADGTQVTLNVDSRLRLPSTFDRGLRQVHLQGEAYFDVASDSGRPFIVRTGGATVEVHGTAFGVRSYPEDRQVEVAVAEGAVSMRAETSGAQKGAKLTAGQLGRFTEAEDRVTTRPVKVNAYLGWTEGQLVFDNTALSQVASQLGRWYDLDFELRDASLKSLHLTATLNSTSVRDVMDVIAASLGIGYRIDGNKVILMDRSARSAAIGFAPRSA